MIGAEGFADFTNGSTTYKDAECLDAKIGVPMNNLMPYARLGFTGTWPNARLHGGLGLEYMFAKNVSVAGEWTTDTSSRDGTKRSNNSVTVGVHYFF